MPADRTRLPQLGPPPPFQFPEIRRTTLANDLDVWTIEQRAVPLVSVLLLVRRGSAADPADRAGLAAITGDLLDEGLASSMPSRFTKRSGVSARRSTPRWARTRPCSVSRFSRGLPDADSHCSGT